jgi:hypothetical protein
VLISFKRIKTEPFNKGQHLLLMCLMSVVFVLAVSCDMTPVPNLNLSSFVPF